MRLSTLVQSETTSFGPWSVNGRLFTPVGSKTTPVLSRGVMILGKFTHVESVAQGGAKHDMREAMWLCQLIRLHRRKRTIVQALQG